MCVIPVKARPIIQMLPVVTTAIPSVLTTPSAHSTFHASSRRLEKSRNVPKAGAHRATTIWTKTTVQRVTVEARTPRSVKEWSPVQLHVYGVAAR